MLLRQNGSVLSPLRSQNEFLIDGIEFLNKFFDPPARESTLCYIGLERYYTIKPSMNNFIYVVFKLDFYAALKQCFDFHNLKFCAVDTPCF